MVGKWVGKWAGKWAWPAKSGECSMGGPDDVGKTE